MASALADSFVAAHPDSTFTVLVIDLGDERVDSDDPRIRVVRPTEAGFSAGRVQPHGDDLHASWSWRRP